MSKVIAAITTSVDGCIVGPEDGPRYGLGVGGERLHYWVMGGPWTYADDGHDPDGMHGPDREYFEALTHRTADQPDPSSGFLFINGFVDELAISTAPVVLGSGKRLFEDFDKDLDLEVLGAWSSPFATRVRYAVKRPEAVSATPDQFCGAGRTRRLA